MSSYVIDTDFLFIHNIISHYTCGGPDLTSHIITGSRCPCRFSRSSVNTYLRWILGGMGHRSQNGDYQRTTASAFLISVRSCRAFFFIFPRSSVVCFEVLCLGWCCEVLCCTFCVCIPRSCRCSISFLFCTCTWSETLISSLKIKYVGWRCWNIVFCLGRFYELYTVISLFGLESLNKFSLFKIYSRDSISHVCNL